MSDPLAGRSPDPGDEMATAKLAPTTQWLSLLVSGLTAIDQKTPPAVEEPRTEGCDDNSPAILNE